MATMDFTPTSGTSNAEGVLRSNGGGWANTWAKARGTTDSAALVETIDSLYTAQIMFTAGPLWQVQHYYFKVSYAALPANAIVTGADFTAWTTIADDAAADGNERASIFLGTQADTLVAGDWAAYSTEYGNNTSDFSVTASWQTIPFNATGYGAINSTVTSAKYCIRAKADVDNTQISAPSGPIFRTAYHATDKPYIRVTYTVPASGFFAL